MTDTLFFPSPAIIDKLFKNGICLTYNPTGSRAGRDYERKLKKEYSEQHSDINTQIVSKTAKLRIPEAYSRFQYFSNGVLIHSYPPDKSEYIERIKIMLAIKKLPLSEIYGPYSNKVVKLYQDFIEQIGIEAQNRYNPQEDLSIEPLPDIKTFVEDCFANNNILLTASKSENLHSFFRREFALFADGRFVVAKGSSMMWCYFRDDYPQYICLYPQTVPQEYIDALYKKAEDYVWFLPKEKCPDKLILDGSRQSDTEIFIYQSLERLFEEGTCLTYDSEGTSEANDYRTKFLWGVQEKYKGRDFYIKSKTAKLQCVKHGSFKFHYFSDGTVVYPNYFDGKHQQEFARIKTMLQLKNLPFRRIFSICNDFKDIEEVQRNNMLFTIDYMAAQKYDFRNDFEVVFLPSKEEFTAQCFADNNVLLTAAKGENFNSEYRQILALFADGQYFISKDYYNSNKADHFKSEYSTYLMLKEIYVPQGYIDALYQKAQEFPWYNNTSTTKFSSEEKEETYRFIANLFSSEKCVSVVNPDPYLPDLSPDVLHYAIFSDGTLMVSDKSLFAKDSAIVSLLHRYYPELDFRIKEVPLNYIDEIYRKLPMHQRGAAIIYEEMLKEKAKKLKQIIGISHYEALDIVAKMANFANWEAVTIRDEAHARELIDAEKKCKEMALHHNSENPLKYQYELYLKNNR